MSLDYCQIKISIEVTPFLLYKCVCECYFPPDNQHAEPVYDWVWSDFDGMIAVMSTTSQKQEPFPISQRKTIHLLKTHVLSITDVQMLFMQGNGWAFVHVM